MKWLRGQGLTLRLLGTIWETLSTKEMETMEVPEGLVREEGMIVRGGGMIVLEGDMTVLEEEIVLDADMTAQEGTVLEGTEVLGGMELAIVELTKIIRDSLQGLNILEL